MFMMTYVNAMVHMTVRQEMIQMVKETIKENYGEAEIEELQIDDCGCVTEATLVRPVFYGFIKDYGYCDKSYPAGRSVINAIQVFVSNDPYWGFESQDGSWVETKIGNCLNHGLWEQTLIMELNL